ncbi:hypothetical protein SKAU_G00282640 [Synaphobranchus kaupii]|uniref:Uncharacterized protein n=1 Tax=Synaphobranchus kaupii TaxID=118154 RepID=A0A9Q1EXC1_SYNKA|nr:hypothetical protein SKAU_G00282640 [Synaphobranchus kaupii]
MAAREAEDEYDVDARHFIERDFYIDDALKSFPTEAEAIDVLQRARNMLALSNLHLHKIASNRVEVVNAFPPEGRAKEIKDLDLSVDEPPVQRSLGPRLLSCVFSDASVKAIAAVAYLKVTHEDGHSEVGFILGKAKLAPVPELTIPRLELCAAVLAVELSELLTEELDMKCLQVICALLTVDPLIKAVAHLRHISRSFIKSKDDISCAGWHLCKTSLTDEDLTQAEHTVIRCVQREAYAEEIKCIMAKRDLLSNSSLRKLHPIIDDNGLLRVGGRLTESKLLRHEANPLLIPGKHHIATLLIRHHHAAVKHQGRHLTEGAVRASGL